VEGVGVPKLMAPTLAGLLSPREGVEPNAGGVPRPAGAVVGELKANPPPVLLAAPNRELPADGMGAAAAVGTVNAPESEPNAGVLVRFNIGCPVDAVGGAVDATPRLPNENTPPEGAGAARKKTRYKFI
jgi:hypothetical protein